MRIFKIVSHSGHIHDLSIIQRYCRDCVNADVFYFTKRKIAFDLLEADRVIMPYIKEVVYPFLGMEFKA